MTSGGRCRILCIVNNRRFSFCLAAVAALAVLRATAMGAAASDAGRRLETAGPRISGPVSVSLQNEIDAAVDRGRTWLLAVQNPDGSWGETNRLAVTAVAALALSHRAAPNAVAAAANAARWMLSPAATNAMHAGGPGFEALVWREIALDAAGLNDSRRKAALASQVVHRSATNGTTPFAAMLLREALAPRSVFLPLPVAATGAPPAALLFADCATAMLPPAAPPPGQTCQNVLARLAAQWGANGPPIDAVFGRARQYWLYARFINRVGGGTLADAAGRVLDWRNDLARTLVASQEMDGRRGGGYWQSEEPGADWAAQPLAETSFALLALDEL